MPDSGSLLLQRKPQRLLYVSWCVPGRAFTATSRFRKQRTAETPVCAVQVEACVAPRAQPLLLAAVAAHASASGSHAGLRAQAAANPWRWVLRRALEVPEAEAPPGASLQGPMAEPGGAHDLAGGNARPAHGEASPLVLRMLKYH
jgi:hypothetical protein